ncbi:RNA 2'-phosphotransferase [Pseudonocardia lacus]|uniref:RNA 2'-phosphotransferase n=1 Tax=Pseudonocardia lacus TaxID=2835865 RepID=UPI001BDBEB1A|nr:RNA 2'-phosphotransferase [Pseudonocardia lacus]
MTDDVRLSKFLALVLRHDPAAAGVELGPGGWVGVDDLLAGLARAGRPIDRARLEAVVANSDKRRYELDGDRIRAAQGHSQPVDLQLEPAVPPDVLFHGTVERFLGSITAEGLRPGRRTHVHLSADVATAEAVGARRGRPVVLRVDAAGLHATGAAFYRASNGVWLTARVPPEWISVDTRER